MTPKITTSLALMCKSHNYNSELLEGEHVYRVGNWVIGKKKRKELVGESVILTESQSTPAYLGGTIVGFVPSVNGKCVVVFKEDKSLMGNADSVKHRGWGSGRGVCYV
jgi:hypothetical protein